jgi:hypothetical protein
MLRYSLVLIASFLFISCSNNVNQYLLKDINVSSSDVTISLLTINMDLLHKDFPEHTFGALRPSERSIFDNSLTTIFSSQTRSTVSGQLNGDVLIKHSYERRSFNLNNRKINILTPSSGTALKDEHNQARFVLILDQFYFTPYEITIGGDSYAGHEPTTQKRVRFETKYVIWDNEKKDAIAWGHVNSNQLHSSSNPSNVYRILLSNTFDQIVRKSPFSTVRFI